MENVTLPEGADQAPPEPCNATGLRAAEISRPLHVSLVDPCWIRFEGDFVAIHGYCLPPDGDPHRISVAFQPGVVGELSYPHARPDVGEHFWYWPNAQASGFIVTIDLAKSEPGSNPFVFDFVCTDNEGSARPLTNGRVWIPETLNSFLGFPPNEDQLSRVQYYSDVQTVGLTGYNDFRRMEALLARYGVKPQPGLRLLDWGCGHGRLTRHFLEHWQGAEIHGLDIDPQNIAWASKALPKGAFAVSELWPPAPLSSASIDAAFGLSVMTHLTAAAQAAWLSELSRILRPGAIAVLTFAGATAAAYSSRWRDPQWWARWKEKGFDDLQMDPALDASLSKQDYYRNTYQTAADVRARWVYPFEVLDVLQDQFGYQDAAVLRRRD